MWESLIIVFLLLLIGSVFVTHFKKPEILYSPWIGAIFLSNIAVILSFAKISVEKNIFEIKYFGGTTFIFLTLIFTLFVSISNRAKWDLGYKKKNNILYFVILISIVLSTFIFFNKPEDRVAVKRADELKQTSLTIEMFVDQNLEQGQWEIGIPVLIGIISTVSSYTTIAISKIIHGLFIVLLDILLANLIIRILKPRERNAHLIVFLAVTLCTFLILQIYIIPLNVVFIIGLFVLIINLMLDLLDRENGSKRLQIFTEEIVLANAFVFIASLNSNIFKIAIGLLFITLVINIVKRKNSSIIILKIIFFILLFNPLLIGLALRS